MAKTRLRRRGGDSFERDGPPPAVETPVDRQLKDVARQRKQNERVVQDHGSGLELHFPEIPDAPSPAEAVICDRYGVDWGKFAYDEVYNQPHVQRADKLVQTLRFLEHHLPDCQDAEKVYDIGCGDWKYVWGLRHYFPKAHIIGVDSIREPEGFKVDLYKQIRNLDLSDETVRRNFDEETLAIITQAQEASPFNCMMGIPPNTDFNPRSVFKIRPQRESVDVILDFCFAGQPDVWCDIGHVMREDGKIKFREQAFDRYMRWLKPGGHLLSVYQATDLHSSYARQNPEILEAKGFEVEAWEKAIHNPAYSWDEVVRARKPP